MDTVLISVSVVAAAFLLLITVAAPQKPTFEKTERLSFYAVKQKIGELSKSCSVTERGSGIRVGEVKKTIKKIYALLDKKTEEGCALEGWEVLIYNRKEKVKEFFRRNRFVLGARLGHVNKLPRLFLFCREFVFSLNGIFSVGMLESAIEIFSEKCNLSADEHAALADMLCFCLYAFIAKTAIELFYYEESYEKGKKDGAEMRADLDYLHNCDYVCGLSETAHENAFVGLLESNGVNHADAYNDRNEKNSVAVATVMSAFASLDAVERAISRRGLKSDNTAVDVEKNEKTKKTVAGVSAGISVAVAVVFGFFVGTVWIVCFLPAVIVLFFGVEAVLSEALGLPRTELFSFVDRLKALTPVFIMFLAFLCSLRYSGAVLVVLCSELIAGVLTCAYRAIARPSMARLREFFDSIFRFIMQPTRAVLSIVSAVDKKGATAARLSKNGRATFFAQMAAGLIVIVFTAVFSDSAWMFTIGGLFFLGAFSELYYEKACKFRLKRKKYVEIVDVKFDQPVDDRIFFDTAAEVTNRLSNGGVSLFVDSGGKIVFGKSGSRSKYRLDMSLADGDGMGALMLNNCDGVFTGYDAVYRSYDDVIETCMRLTVPPSQGCVLIKLDVINRTENVVKKDFDLSVLSDAGRGGAYNKFRSGGVVYKAADEYIGVCCTRTARHDVKKSVLGAFGKPKVLISTNGSLVLGAFSCESIIFGILIQNDRIVANSFALIDEAYFDHALNCAFVYSQTDKQNQSDEKHYKENAGRFLRRRGDNYSFPDVELDTVTLDHVTSYGSIGSDGIVFDGKKTGGKCRAVSRLADDADFYVDIAADGDSIELFNGLPLFPSDEHVGVHLAESDCIWSPCGPLAGNSNIVAFYKGVCEYTSGANGCVSRLKRYVARGCSAEIFDLTVSNRTNKQRKISVALSFGISNDAGLSYDGGMHVCCAENGVGLFVCCSEPTASFCENIKSVLNMRSVSVFGGNVGCIAPMFIPPHKESRVVFALAAYSDIPKLTRIDKLLADRYLQAEKGRFRSIEHIKLFSDDIRLDTLYSQSLYRAYVCLLSESSIKKTLILCFGAKYADAECVKNKLKAICRRQEHNGELKDECGGIGATALLPLALLDYADFSCDYAFLGESIGFGGAGDGKECSVLEHCMRAVSRAVTYAESAQYDICVEEAFLLSASIRAVMDYLSHSARKKRFVSALMRLSDSARQFVFSLETSKSGYGLSGAASVLIKYIQGDAEGAFKALSEYAADATDNIGAFLCDFDGTAESVFYAAVTERFLGISVRGGTARVNPAIESGMRRAALELMFSDVKTSVTIDNSEPDGSWQMNVDRIAIASNKLGLTDGDGHRHVVFKRSGA